MNDIKAVVTEDWQRDALRVILVDHNARRVSQVQVLGPSCPVFQMLPYDPEAMTREEEQDAGLLLPLVVARALYEALGRHFGDHQDPGSRELVDALQSQVLAEGIRVDAALDALVKIATRRQ